MNQVELLFTDKYVFFNSNHIYKKLCTKILKRHIKTEAFFAHIESGHWNRPHPTPRENRLCSTCNILEDEFHFMFECTLYNYDKHFLIKPYYRRRYSMFKLIELFPSSNKTILTKLGISIYKVSKNAQKSISGETDRFLILFVTLQLNTSIIILSKFV